MTRFRNGYASGKVWYGPTQNHHVERPADPLICNCIHSGLRQGLALVAAILLGLLLIVGISGVTP